MSRTNSKPTGDAAGVPRPAGRGPVRRECPSRPAERRRRLAATTTRAGTGRTSQQPLWIGVLIKGKNRGHSCASNSIAKLRIFTVTLFNAIFRKTIVVLSFLRFCINQIKTWIQIYEIYANTRWAYQRALFGTNELAWNLWPSNTIVIGHQLDLLPNLWSGLEISIKPSYKH